MPRFPGELCARRLARLAAGRGLPRPWSGAWEVKRLKPLQTRLKRAIIAAVARTDSRRCIARRRALLPHWLRPAGGAGPKFKRSSLGMRDPYEVLGVDRKASARRYQERLPASSPRSCIRTPTRTIRRRHRASPSSTPRTKSLAMTDKRKAFDRGEIDAEGKPRFQGFEGLAAVEAGRRAGGGFGPDANFETFNFGPEGFTAPPARTWRGAGGGGFGGFEDILKEMFSGGGRGGGRRRSNSSRKISASAADVSRNCRPSRCRTRPTASTQRAASADRQGCRRQNSGRASPTVSTSGSRVRACRAGRSPAIS